MVPFAESGWVGAGETGSLAVLIPNTRLNGSSTDEIEGKGIARAGAERFIKDGAETGTSSGVLDPCFQRKGSRTQGRRIGDFDRLIRPVQRECLPDFAGGSRKAAR